MTIETAKKTASNNHKFAWNHFFSVVVLVLGFFLLSSVHCVPCCYTHLSFEMDSRTIPTFMAFVRCWLVGRPFHLDESGSSEKHAKDWSLNRVKQLHKCFCFFKTNNRSSCIDNNTRHKHDLNIALSPRRKFTPHSQLTWNAWRSFCGHNNNISLT